MKHSIRKIFITLGISALAGTTTSAATLNGPISNPNNGHSYFLLSQNTWTASEVEALTLGGHLATINDLAENQWVFDTFMPLTGRTRPALWIGLNDAVVEGTFVWSSGEPVTFTDWYPGEPNDLRGEDYAHIRDPLAGGLVGSWNDLADVAESGSIPMFGVVEVVPEPPTYALFALGTLGVMIFRSWRKDRKIAPPPEERQAD